MSTTLTTRQTAGTGATVKGSPLTNAEVDANFINLNVAVLPTGGTAGQVLSKVDGTNFNAQWIDNFSTALKIDVKNSTGATIPKGSAVYVSGAVGANVLVALAQANAEATSSQTLGLVEADIANGSTGNVIYTGTITGVNTIAYTEGDPVYLSGATAGGIVVGLANKPSAPTHLVYLGVITRSHAVNGEIQIRVSNGWELNEIHDVQIVSKANNDILQYSSASGVWKNVTPATARTNLGLAIGTDVQAFSSSLSAISASQTANTFLAAPNGAAGVPTFRALVAADVPTLNQNTTGNAATATTATTANALNSANTYSVAKLTATANTTGVGTGITVINGDLTAYRSGGTTGVVYLSNSGSNYLYWDGTNYNLNAGNLVCTGNITAYSDETLKTNWRDLPTDFVESLAELQHGIYTRIDSGDDQAGISAQKLQRFLAAAVQTDQKGKLSVAYGNAAMVSAVQLAKRLIALEAKVAKIVE